MLKITEVCLVVTALLSLALAGVNADSDRCTQAPEETVHACAACAAALQISMDACCTNEQVLEFCQNLPRMINDDVMDSNQMAERRAADDSWTAETEEDAVNSKRNNMYLLGKRPRNNFLGKRGDEMAAQQDMLEDMEKRAPRYFLGKRASRYFLGKRDGDDMEKRGRLFLGKRGDEAFDGIATSEDKRSRQPFLGKRGRLFLGKRADQEEPLSEMIKRDKYFLGKKAKYFLGKRSGGISGSDQVSLDDDAVQAGDAAAKRAQKYFLGK